MTSIMSNLMCIYFAYNHVNMEAESREPLRSNNNCRGAYELNKKRPRKPKDKGNDNEKGIMTTTMKKVGETVGIISDEGNDDEKGPTPVFIQDFRTDHPFVVNP
ncbi:hypothetical protein L1987_75761 [Smallanthus sonchifolius]|uniref:Uncharacterized protein n=1 Tax=Smallanthus sonchifolius TaxID=185202 RepID=A0ACB9A6Q0_9ASTR|nr:hypothetical protein L1987_75761 [Smallanthus sonchifolius]